MSARLENWEPALLALLEAARARPFRLGQWDCALFAGAAVAAQAGIDLLADYRGKYSTVGGYTRLLRRRGHADLFGLFDPLGPRVAPLLCARGDVVSNGEAVGVMWAGHALFVGGVTEEAGGLIAVAPSALRWGWRV